MFILAICSIGGKLSAQQPLKQLNLSELFSREGVSIFKLSTGTEPPDLYDTVKVSFILYNDFEKDTTVYYAEASNDWFSFRATPADNKYPAIEQVSGRRYFGKLAYENVYFPVQKLILKANTVYYCLVKWRSDSYKPAHTGPYLMSGYSYLEINKKAQKAVYTSNIINFFFTGAICFGFFLFLFLYYKSRYGLFGLYAAFLFLQACYGVVFYDVYTTVGSMFMTHFDWDEYVTELFVFAGLAIYVQFIIGWLRIRQTSTRLAGIFNVLSIFFALYAVSFVILYSIAPHWHFLSVARDGVRIISFVFQLFLFYNIIFKIKTAGRWYILTGNILLMIMALIMIYIRQRGGFVNTWFEDIDNASWYMLGVLCECLCFTIGMGQHYFQLQTEKNMLQIENLEARQLKLEAEENNLRDRLRISQDLHDNIGSTLSSISVYSQVAKIYGEKPAKEDLNELLEKISHTSNEMVTEMNDIVWAINPGNDSMEKIISRMESFARPLASARNIQFDFMYESSVCSLQLDMDRRKNFYLIFKEAVNNAIKYSGASALLAKINIDKDTLVLSVNDNGVGFNPEKETAANSTSLSGNGLKNMYNRASLLKGNLTVISRAGIGTNITLQLPLA